LLSVAVEILKYCQVKCVNENVLITQYHLSEERLVALTARTDNKVLSTISSAAYFLCVYVAVTLFELTVVNNWWIIMVSSLLCKLDCSHHR
jgi:hypothetical protein